MYGRVCPDQEEDEEVVSLSVCALHEKIGSPGVFGAYNMARSPLWQALFGGDSVVDSALGGMVLGNMLDERVDRAKTISLLENIAAQGEALADERASEKDEAARSAWKWVWPFESQCDMMYLAAARLMHSPSGMKERNPIVREWEELKNRAIAVGVVPTIYMPRSLNGDIAGTPRCLHAALGVLKELVEIREGEAELLRRERELNAKFGVVDEQ